MAKLRLTTTQQALLAMARKFDGRIVTSTYCGRGADGGALKGGSRQRDAAQGLRDKGLVEFVKHDRHIHYNNGYGIHTCDTTWRLLIMV